MKIYRARTGYSTSIVLPSGKTKYLIFDSESNGTSVLKVTSKAVASALERKKEFGSIFYLEASDEEPSQEYGGNAQAVISEDTRKGEDAIKSAGEENAYKEIKVESWEDAKRYMVEELGYPANKVRTQSQIQKKADEEGIRFIM